VEFKMGLMMVQNTQTAASRAAEQPKKAETWASSWPRGYLDLNFASFSHERPAQRSRRLEIIQEA